MLENCRKIIKFATSASWKIVDQKSFGWKIVGSEKILGPENAGIKNSGPKILNYYNILSAYPSRWLSR